MSPYRSVPRSSEARVVRLAEPMPSAGLLLACVMCFGPLPWALAEGDTLFWPGVFAVAGVFVSVFLFLCRHRAWIIVMRNEERVRVVRLRGLSYSASTLRLSASMSVECSPIGNTMWLFVVAEDGRFARVLPTASMGMLERVEDALAR